MGRCQISTLLTLGLTLAGCTADPTAPMNQSFPIRQMDNFFNSLSGPPADLPSHAAAPQDYTHAPGYAPAYPPY